jgi:hypothetical protein
MGCGREGTQQRTEHSWKIATKKKTTAAKPYFAPIIRSNATAPIKVIAPHLPTTKDKEISPKTLRPQGYSWDKHKKKRNKLILKIKIKNNNDVIMPVSGWEVVHGASQAQNFTISRRPLDKPSLRTSSL